MVLPERIELSTSPLPRAAEAYCYCLASQKGGFIIKKRIFLPEKHYLKID